MLVSASICAENEQHSDRNLPSGVQINNLQLPLAQTPLTLPPSPTPNISYHHRGTVPHVIMTRAQSGYPAGGLRDQTKTQRHSWRQTTCEKPQEEGEKVEQHPRCFSKWSVHSWRTNAGWCLCRAIPERGAVLRKEVRGDREGRRGCED